MAVTYENAIVVDGRFSHDEGDIETVIVPASTTLNKYSIMGEISTSGANFGKYKLSLNAATDGTEVAKAISAEEIVNATESEVEVKAVIYKKGTFNSLGVTFGTGQTLANTKDDLHKVSIEITQGEA